MFQICSIEADPRNCHPLARGVMPINSPLGRYDNGKAPSTSSLLVQKWINKRGELRGASAHCLFFLLTTIRETAITTMITAVAIRYGGYVRMFSRRALESPAHWSSEKGGRKFSFPSHGGVGGGGAAWLGPFLLMRTTAVAIMTTARPAIVAKNHG